MARPNRRISGRLTAVLQLCLIGVALGPGALAVRAALPAPMLLSPISGQTGVAPMLTWTAVPGAVTYRVRVQTSLWAVDPIDTVNTSLGGDLVLPRGPVEWTVAVVAADTSESVSATGGFTVNPALPQLLTPSNAAIVTFPDQSPTLSWSTSVGSGVGFAYGDQTIAPGTPTDLIDLGINGHTGMLAPGPWRWAVKEANNAAGATSATRTFTVVWEDSAPVQTSPANGATLTTSAARLAWDPVPGVMGYDVQVDDTANLSSSTLNRTLGTSFAARLEPGQWYWRVRAVAPSSAPQEIAGAWSSTRSLTVPDLLAPTIIGPADSDSLTEYPILQWEPDPAAADYELSTKTAVADPNPTSILTRSTAIAYTVSGGGQLVAAPGIQPRTVWWRVRSIAGSFSGAAGPWTAWQTFVVNPSNTQPIDDPVIPTLSAPADCADPGTCPAAAGSPILDWATVDGATLYRVFYSSGPGLLGWVDAAGSSFVLPPTIEGTSIEWNIAACGSALACPDTMPAGSRSFQRASAPVSLLGPADDAVIAEPAVELSWLPSIAPDDIASWPIASYEVWSQRTHPVGGVQTPATSIVAHPVTSFTFASLQDGESVAWRVRAVPAFGVPSAWSETRTVTRAVDPLVITSPAEDAIVDSTPSLAWEVSDVPTPGYRVQVARGTWSVGDTWPFETWSFDAPGASLDVFPSLPPGDYTWRVNRNSDLPGTQMAGPSSVGHFSIAGVAPPVLTAPAAGSNVADDRAVFSWNPVVGADWYAIEISTDDGFAQDDRVERVLLPTTSYAPRIRLPNASLFWRITAFAPGYVGIGSTDSQFEIGTSSPRLMTAVPGSVADTTPPTGTISIASGAVHTKTAGVTVGVAATDAATGVSQVQLSNDGVTWTTRAYNPTQAWTLAAGNGTRTVWARWRDGAGNLSTEKADTIVLDSVVPSATGVAQSFPAVSTIVADKIPTRIAWSGSDATSGIARYDVSNQTDGGPWSAPISVTAAATTPTLAPGHTYRYKVRPIDRAGNVGAWAYGTTFRLTGHNESSGSIAYTGTWANVTTTAYWGGAAKAASVAGAKATFTFTGRSVGWVALRSPARGKANVYVDGAFVKSVDLYAAGVEGRRIVWSANWTTAATRTVEIRVVGTPTRPRIDVDGFVTGS